MELSDTIEEITPERIQILWKILVRTAKIAPSHKTGQGPFPKMWIQYYKKRCFITLQLENKFYNYVVVPGKPGELEKNREKYLKE